MESLLLALYKKTAPGADNFDKLISFGTRSLYTHSEIIHIRKGGIVQLSVSPRDTAFRGKEHLVDEDTWDYFKIDSLDEAKALSKAYALLGVKYDWLALSGFITRIKVNSNTRMFCSESSTEIIQAGGVKLFNHSKPYMVSPAMLGDNPLCIKVNIGDYL